MLPNHNQIEILHHRYAPSDHVFTLVYTHCQIVYDIASQLIEQKNSIIDTDLVKAGALLHDIGAYQFINAQGKFDESHYIRHGIVGYDILKEQGFPEQLCRIAAHHTGTGIAKEEIERKHLPLPPQNYFAETLGEKLIMYADKFHSKYPRFNTFESYEKHLEQFGKENVKRFYELRELFGVPDMASIAEKYKDFH